MVAALFDPDRIDRRRADRRCVFALPSRGARRCRRAPPMWWILGSARRWTRSGTHGKARAL